LRPTWRLAGAGTLWLVLEWYGATSEVSWLFLLAAWVLALIVGSAAYALWNRRGLRLDLEVRRSLPAADSPAEELPEQLIRTSPTASPVFEGDGLDLAVGLRTNGGARGPAMVRGEVGGHRIEFGTGLVPTTGWSRITELRELRRGPVGARRWTIGTSDPLGFFRGERTWSDSEVAIVLPRFASLAGRREPHEMEASTASPWAGYGNEVFGVREYRAGDSLRRIHWRSTARRGELVVREFEPPGLQTLTILVDPHPPSVQAADQIARLAASETWDCIREGGRVVIGGPGLDPVGPSRDLWSLLEWLARYPDGSPRPSGPAGHLPMNGEEVVVITATADPLLIEEGERARRRRAWLVGDVSVVTDIPFERAGLEWPL
jgi:uncharacterized protein (DUF58 family)